jgi:hypothetical protein
LAQVIKKRFVKVILWVLLSFFLLLALVAGLIQIPYVQNRIVGYLSEYYSEQTGFGIRLDHINIDWFDQIKIEGLQVIDPADNEMIWAQNVLVDFSIGSLIDKSNRNIDEIIIDSARIYLTKIPYNDSVQTLNFNELARRVKALIRRQSNTRKYFTVDDVVLNNAQFRYNDTERDSIKNRFDYFHFDIENINGEFKNLISISDTLAMDVLSLEGLQPETMLRIKDMQSFFRVSQAAMEFYDLDLKVGNSRIQDSVRLTYNSTTELSEFTTKVNILAHLDNSVIYSKDLAHFATFFHPIEDYYKLSGDFQGRVNNFTLNDANLRFGDKTSINGRIRMIGLPEFSETFIDFDLNESYIFTEDTKPYIKPATFVRLSPFRDIYLSSKFLGFPNDFVANGAFETNLGNFSTDINLKIEDDINQSSYTGSLDVQDFDLGGYSGQPYFQKVTMKGEIEGQGFTLEEANFVLQGEIQKIGINNYQYTNIITDARFAKEFFEGYLSVDDPNLKLTTTGSIDLREGINLFNVRATLDSARLMELNITDEPFFITSTLSIDAQGLEVDNVQGKARFKDTYLFYRNKGLTLDSLEVVAEKDSTGYRNIHFFSNLFAADVEGTFDMSILFRDLSNLYKEYRLNFSNNRSDIRDYYSSKVIDPKDYALHYSITLSDMEPLLKVFLPEVDISRKTNIYGSYTGGYTSIFSMNAHPDTLIYGTQSFYENDIQVSVSKIADSTNVLAMIFMNSKDQLIQKTRTENLYLEAIWNNTHIDFEMDIDQVAYPNYARLLGSLDFLPEQTVMHIKPSQINILDKKWAIDPNNRVTFKDDFISVEQLNLFNEDQLIALQGVVSTMPDDALNLSLKSLRLENLNSLLKDKLSGTVNGFVTLKDYYGTRKIESEFNVQEFTLDDFLIGDIYGTNFWENEARQFNTSLYIMRNTRKVLDLSGTYTPEAGDNQLNLTANLNQTELKVLEPFFNEYFTGIEGTASGIIDISGRLTSPFIRGEGRLNDGRIHVNYLNTDYTFDGGFYLEPNKIGFQRVNLQDIRNQRALLSGFIGHDNYKDFTMNLEGIMSSFTVLDTKATDNDLFYGTGIATGEISFTGPVRNMAITATAQTERGTRIFIPIGDTETIEKEEFINFVNLNDSVITQAVEEIKRVDLRGLKLDFDLNITPEAYCEIIFDIKSGDIIRGRGSGDLKLQIDTKGDFNMFGDFEFQEGGYNFTLYNIINKEFQILNSSRISWYGDPYQGILDIKATYDQLASFLPILSQPGTQNDVYQDSPELRRKYPVQVLLNIDGPILTPSVDFDILANDLPRNINLSDGDSKDLEFEFMNFKNRIDEQELKRQVFSLIVLRKFSPLQSFNTGGSITSSVSELLSNQLSYWITQVDENLEIDLDLGNFDQEAFNTFQLRLSYTFLDGRLRVTRAGGFTNQENRADISSIAGDWTVEYLLSPDGKFKVKMYNRTTFNPINPNEDNQNTITTGFSIIHTQNFDEIREIFNKTKKEKLPLEDENENENESVPLVNLKQEDEETD